MPLLGEAILSGNEDGATPSINLEVCHESTTCRLGVLLSLIVSAVLHIRSPNHQLAPGKIGVQGKQYSATASSSLCPGLHPSHTESLNHRQLIVMQGYLIGNGATDSATDNINIFSLFSTWPLLPQSLAANLTSYNCGTLSNPIGEHNGACVQ